jgi:hypothetical protein
MKFPNVVGKNLLRQTIHFPQDLKADLNLLFVPFWQWQQEEVDSWVPFAQELVGQIKNFDFFELPTIESRGKFSQWIINEGMRAGIPNNPTRARTITLYLDKRKFRQALDIQDEDHIHLFIVNRAGDVLYHERGEFDPKKGKALHIKLKKLSKE